MPGKIDLNDWWEKRTPSAVGVKDLGNNLKVLKW